MGILFSTFNSMIISIEEGACVTKQGFLSLTLKND